MQAGDLLRELHGFHRDAIKMLRLGGRRRDGVGIERPGFGQFPGFDLALPDAQQKLARGSHGIRSQVALTNPPTEDHHLPELRRHRAKDAQVGVMAGEPADEFGVEHVERNDEDQEAVVLQERQRLLVEELFEPGAALAFVALVAKGVSGEIAVGRIEPQKAEGLSADDRIHQVAVNAMIDESSGMTRALGVVFDGKRSGLFAPEGVRGFGDRHAFAGAGVDEIHWPVAGRERGERALQRRLVGRKIPGLGEILGQTGEHECHERLLGEKGKRQARQGARPCPAKRFRRRAGAVRALGSRRCR